MRATSREAYDELVRLGKLKGKQQRALDALIQCGTGTTGEVIRAMGEPNVNLWRARFTDLQARGLIREIGERRCTVTRRQSLVWEPTGRTKPLDVSRGHRVTGNAKDWRYLARAFRGWVLDSWMGDVVPVVLNDHDKRELERLEKLFLRAEGRKV